MSKWIFYKYSDSVQQLLCIAVIIYTKPLTWENIPALFLNFVNILFSYVIIYELKFIYWSSFSQWRGISSSRHWISLNIYLDTPHQHLSSLLSLRKEVNKWRPFIYIRFVFYYLPSSAWSQIKWSFFRNLRQILKLCRFKVTKNFILKRAFWKLYYYFILLLYYYFFNYFILILFLR